MVFVNSLKGRHLAFALVIISFNSFGQINCKEITASIESFNTKVDLQDGSVKINFKEQASSSFVIYLFGPGRYLKKDIQQEEVKGLKRGSYTLVLVGRNEQDNFCQKHFEFIIK